MDFSCCLLKNPKDLTSVACSPVSYKNLLQFFDVYIKYVIFREEVDVNVSQLSELVESYLQFCYVNQRNFVFQFFF